MIHVLHNQLPGRTRYKIDGLSNNTDLKTHLEARLGEHHDIARVSVNTVTGNMLVCYSTGKSHGAVASLIRKALAEVNHTGKTQAQPKQQPRKTAQNSSSSISGRVADDAARASTAAHRKNRLDDTARDWHATDVDAVVRMLDTHPEAGLTRQKAEAHYNRYGPNTLPEKKSRPKWYDVMDQLNAVPSYLLGAAAGLSILTGGILDAAIITGVLAANVAIGTATESKADGTIRSLKSFMSPAAWVMREGKSVEVPIERIVIGDVLVLKPGVYVAADARIIRATNLTVDESMLTGESVPAKKDAATLTSVDTPLPGRSNMVYRGTQVTGGQGFAAVTATGEITEVGMLQSLLHHTESPPSPIERQLDQLGNQLVVICGLVCAGVFGIGFLRGYGLLAMLRMAVSLAAAAVPEGLPTAAMMNFALGLNRMKERHILVRHLQAAETLGAIQTICFDKTGTITQNRMAVTAVFAGMRSFSVEGGRIFQGNDLVVCDTIPELHRLFMTCVLCSETQAVENGSNGGIEIDMSPTERALIETALENGVDIRRLSDEHRLAGLEHRSENQLFMTAFHETPPGEKILSIKGSPPEVLAMCSRQMVDGRVVPLEEQARRRIGIENEQMAGHRALRVLGVAWKQSHDWAGANGDLIWLGLVGMADPVRPGVKDLIEVFHRAGIDTVMITGDQSSTASAVAGQLNLSGGEPLEILDSSALPSMEPEKLAAVAKRVKVYSRVSPSHKLKIVQGLQNGGRIIAMTGDGINDGPALKAADIGIAMGVSGTDVAREVADVVLEQDNLETLMIAVRDGRAIYSNIRKSVHFFLSTNMSEIMLILGSVGMGLGFPLNVMQLLWINIISDILPGLALSLEEAEPDNMRQPPRDPNAPIFNRRDFTRMAAESGVMTAASMGAYLYGISRYGSGARAGTLAFHSLTMGQLLHAFSCRSDRRHLPGDEKLPPNPHLNRAIGGSLALQVLTMLVPPVRRFLGVSPINLLDGVVIAAGSVLPYWINEMRKKKVTDV